MSAPLFQSYMKRGEKKKQKKQMIKVILYVYIRYVFILNLFRLYTSTIQHYNSNRRKKDANRLSKWFISKK